MEPRICYSANATERRERIQIFKYDGRHCLLEIVDNLKLDTRASKVKIVAVKYDDNNRAISTVCHWMDTTEIKTLCKAIIDGRLLRLRGFTAEQLAAGEVKVYEEFKGSKQPDQTWESRVLRIRYDQRAKLPYKIVITNGPGRPGPTGAVMPAGDATGDVMIPISLWDLSTLAGEVLDYIRDWETVNFRARQKANKVVTLPMSEAPAEVQAMRAARPVQKPHNNYQKMTANS